MLQISTRTHDWNALLWPFTRTQVVPAVSAAGFQEFSEMHRVDSGVADVVAVLANRGVDKESSWGCVELKVQPVA